MASLVEKKDNVIKKLEEENLMRNRIEYKIRDELTIKEVELISIREECKITSFKFIVVR